MSVAQCVFNVEVEADRHRRQYAFIVNTRFQGTMVVFIAIPSTAAPRRHSVARAHCMAARLGPSGKHGLNLAAEEQERECAMSQIRFSIQFARALLSQPELVETSAQTSLPGKLCDICAIPWPSGKEFELLFSPVGLAQQIKVKAVQTNLALNSEAWHLASERWYAHHHQSDIQTSATVLAEIDAAISNHCRHLTRETCQEPIKTLRGLSKSGIQRYSEGWPVVLNENGQKEPIDCLGDQLAGAALHPTRQTAVASVRHRLMQAALASGHDSGQNHIDGAASLSGLVQEVRANEAHSAHHRVKGSSAARVGAPRAACRLSPPRRGAGANEGHCGEAHHGDASEEGRRFH
eukprot:6212847-Pleurochrysis_carterae.AAC.1